MATPTKHETGKESLLKSPIKHQQDEEKVVSASVATTTTTNNAARFKVMLLILMVFQNSSTVLVGRYTRSSVPKEEAFVVNQLVMITELAKLVLSLGLESYTSKGQLMKSIQIHILQNPLDALKIAVPALLYLIQNTLLYVALSNLSAPLFQVTYQGKLVTTAVVSVFMLNRSYSIQQWVCLITLSCGVAIVVLGENNKKSDMTAHSAQSLAVGLMAVTIACLCSALAGVYFEKVLKKKSSSAAESSKPPVSMWLRNVQLAFFSILIALFQQRVQAASADSSKPWLFGFTKWVWLLVSLQAGGGLLVAAVIKYADNVLKGLATGVSVVVATAGSTVFFGTPLRIQFCEGAILILTSVYLFNNPLPQRCLFWTRTGLFWMTEGTRSLSSPSSSSSSSTILPR